MLKRGLAPKKTLIRRSIKGPTVNSILKLAEEYAQSLSKITHSAVSVDMKASIRRSGGKKDAR